MPSSLWAVQNRNANYRVGRTVRKQFSWIKHSKMYNYSATLVFGYGLVGLICTAGNASWSRSCFKLYKSVDKNAWLSQQVIVHGVWLALLQIPLADGFSSTQL